MFARSCLVLVAALLTINSCSALITETHCMGFFLQGVDLTDYDRYEEYFHTSSRMTLAQAGDYYGADSIREYVEFLSDASPYILEGTSFERTAILTGIDSLTNECYFNMPGYASLTLAEEYSGQGRDVVTRLTSSFKVAYNPLTQKLNYVNVYLSKEIVNDFFTMWDNNATAEFVCSTLMNNCTDVWNQNNLTSMDLCLTKLAALPVATDSNGILYADGYDRSCRILHAAFAVSNPDHCPHISFIPIEDKNGKLKCQTSSQYPLGYGFSADDLFNFNVYSLSKDLATGYVAYNASQTAAMNKQAEIDAQVADIATKLANGEAICTAEDTESNGSASQLLIAGCIFLAWIVFVVIVSGCLLRKNINFSGPVVVDEGDKDLLEE